MDGFLGNCCNQVTCFTKLSPLLCVCPVKLKSKKKHFYDLNTKFNDLVLNKRREFP